MEPFSVLKCEQMLNAYPHMPLISYTAALLLDAYLISHQFRDVTDLTFQWKQCEWTYVKCDMLLPPQLCQYVHNHISYFHPLTDVSSNLAHLLTKIMVNSRCQARGMGDVVGKLLIQRSNRTKRRSRKQTEHVEFDAQYLELVKHVILCTLLGNYPTELDAQIRPHDIQIRQMLYYLFATPRYDPWVLRLVKFTPSVLTFSLRRYLVFTLENNPGMLHYLHHTLRFDEYSKIVNEAVTKMVECFKEMILSDPKTSLFYQCLHSVPIERCHTLKLWVCGHKECKEKSRKEGGNSLCLYAPVSLQNDRLQQLYYHEQAQQSNTGWKDDQPHAFHKVFKAQLLEYERRFQALGESRKHVDSDTLLRPMRRKRTE